MHITRRMRSSVLIATTLLLAACGTPPPTGAGSTSGGSTDTSTVSAPTTSAAPTTTTPPDPTAGLTIEQKVGQLMMVGGAASAIPQATYDAITTLHVGNVILTGRSSMGVDATAASVSSLVAEVSPESTGEVPLLVAADQEGGQVQTLKGPGFDLMPTALEQGKLDPAALEQAAAMWGAQLRQAGVNLNLAPVLDVVPSAQFAPQNKPIGYFDRGYGYSPATVSAHGNAFADGMSTAKVATSLKHFPGLGNVTGNTDTDAKVTDTVIDVQSPSLVPFRDGIKAGAPLVMISSAYYTRIDADNPAVFSTKVITGLLREQLGFTGVVISDDVGNATQLAQWSPGDRAVKFLRAGGDVVLTVDPTQAPAMVAALIAAANADPVFADQVTAAVARVLKLKTEFA